MFPALRGLFTKPEPDQKRITPVRRQDGYGSNSNSEAISSLSVEESKNLKWIEDQKIATAKWLKELVASKDRSLKALEQFEATLKKCMTSHTPEVIQSDPKAASKAAKAASAETWMQWNASLRKDGWDSKMDVGYGGEIMGIFKPRPRRIDHEQYVHDDEIAKMRHYLCEIDFQLEPKKVAEAPEDGSGDRPGDPPGDRKPGEKKGVDEKDKEAPSDKVTILKNLVSLAPKEFIAGLYKLKSMQAEAKELFKVPPLLLEAQKELYQAVHQAMVLLELALTNCSLPGTQLVTDKNLNLLLSTIDILYSSLPKMFNELAAENVLSYKYYLKYENDLKHDTAVSASESTQEQLELALKLELIPRQAEQDSIVELSKELTKLLNLRHDARKNVTLMHEQHKATSTARVARLGGNS